MSRKYFGTDGIRGTANKSPMTAGMALKVAMATSLVLRERSEGKPMNRVVIGKDTRLSGYMLEQAMASGFVAMGMDVIRTGPIPTPAVARLTSTLRADIGVMISASHNPYQDNGIKLFGADGYKLSDEIEMAIEAAMDDDLEAQLPSPDKIGKATQLDDASGRYVEYIKRSFPKGQTLEGMKVVIDCANGAAYKVAPQVLWELEADVVKVGDKPNGRNINDGVGATATESLQEKVVEEGADIGIALDGDADRVIIVDEKGQRVDGDQLMGLLALMKQSQGFLKNSTVVATVMSNLGLEKFLETQGINLERTAVGDRYVVERMREGDFNLGGEQSGHIVLSDFGTTGDGLLAALQVLAAVKEAGKKVSEVCHVFDPYPQVLKNVSYKQGAPLDTVEVKDAISKAEADLMGDGRLLVRASGTEPLIRVMAEGQDMSKVNAAVNHVCEAVQKVA
ncbi:MAG: phosphoglucosamine mutase [Alphaproteobacteria bacterium]|nr:phosphoglucosamine mutase [Alphaproteobacteria bacterium]